jgi:murein L,D-transpeptidase YcbB/YkuD
MKRILLTLVIAVTTAAQTIEVPPATLPARQLKAHLDRGAEAHVRNVYAPAGYPLLWTRNGRPTAQAQAVIAVMNDAGQKALDPSRYKVAFTDPIQFDIAMTTAAIRYASDLRIGRTHPTAQFELDADAKQVYLPDLVTRMSMAADPVSILSALEPQSDEYRRLLAALATWRRIAAESANDTALPVAAKLVPGDTYAALPQLASRLRRFEDLTTNFEGTTYDGAIVDAVKHFQTRHGLEADGVISTRTFAALNVPAAQRVQQIEWSLERHRWSTATTGGPSIVVNIPEFRLTARNARGETLEMRVVVGRASRNETPVFEGDLRTVVFRPSWSVPMTIQRAEIAPKLEKDPGYLARNHYELSNGSTTIDAETIQQIRTGAIRVRQKPGGSNALGLVKFFFPNDNDVYLHSTPQQSLFARARRDFSHGCIRVEQPEALAAFVLGWRPEKVRAAMNGKRDDNYVKLAESVNVRILYATAVARANGDVHFFDDIYGHDVELARVLAPRTKPAAAVVAAR